ncbi:twinkle mtDNA helicase [Hyalella azteca]|uniref:Twinkle mtDNA helicase n=1 Tax=Hyalella azteca TaxID=294128 RepID=A0A8B7PFJ5_HYAAZ|nr:twinkle mtDNA helicase [Hyalella azteca]
MALLHMAKPIIFHHPCRSVLCKQPLMKRKARHDCHIPNSNIVSYKQFNCLSYRSYTIGNYKNGIIYSAESVKTAVIRSKKPINPPILSINHVCSKLFCSGIPLFPFRNSVESITSVGLNKQYNNLVKISRPPDSSKHCLHTSFHKLSSNIPDYLVGIITEIECPEDENDLNWNDFELEEEIAEFLSSRAIDFDETDCSFIVQCPTCSSSCGSTQHKDIFVDKNTGYFVCPWCCKAGTWEELCQLLDAKQDVLTCSQLHSFLHSTLPLNETFLSSLKSTPCKGLSLDVLKQYGCRSSSDGSRLIVPVYRPMIDQSMVNISGSRNNLLQPVGYFSIPLLQKSPQIVSRFVEGHMCAWSSLIIPSPTEAAGRSPTELLVVSSILDALHLAQLNIPCSVLAGGSKHWDTLENNFPLNGSHGSVNLWGLPGSVKRVLLWLNQGFVLPYRFYKFISSAGIACNFVNTSSELELHQLNKDQILARLLTHQQLRLSNSLLTYDNIKEKVYHRIKHPCEVRGVPWARFPELNRVLLGHRSGEVTVVSGPTGAGKTTFLAEYSLDLAVQGVVTLWASLEVSVERLAEVLLQQYSGAPLPTDRTSFDALSYLFKQVPLHFLDVHGQQELEVIMQALRESVMVRGVRHVVVDNLQFLVGCQRSFSERWQHQDLAMAAFRSFATQFGCHVTLIVHPRKLQADELLTMQSIGGGARVTQEADNVMLLQVQGSNPVSCRKAIEVVKNRFGGHLGVVPIKFHQESLTFSGFFRKSKDSQKNKEGKQRPPESREL